jgi:putative FmdB family regulatory protein
MPTYVYACDTCGTQFEQFQSFKDEPLRTCPSCAGAVRRVFQPVGIVFKGAGWYITDSRKSGSATVSSDDSAGKAEKATAGDTPAKADAKSEPVAKSEPASEAKSSSESKPTT